MMLFLLFACIGPDPKDSEACSTSSGTICPYAGTGEAGIAYDAKDRLDTMLYFPMDVEVKDGKPPIIVDWNNNIVRQVLPDETVSFAVGTGYAGDGAPDEADKQPGGAPGTVTALNHPTDALWMKDGNLLIANWHNYKLRVWNPSTGYVEVIAGDFIGFGGDGGPCKEALMNQPHSVAIDEDDNIYIADMRNGRIRMISPDHIMHTVGGNGTQGFAGDGGPLLDAVFNFPIGDTPRPGGSVTVDGNTLYIADTLNHRIRSADLSTGIIQTIVGTGVPGFSGDGGPAISAQLNNPIDIEVGDGKLYIADTDNSRIRIVDLSTGIIDTFAGTGTPEWSGDGGPATEAALHFPYGIGLADDGRVFIADTYNQMIRVVYP